MICTEEYADARELCDYASRAFLRAGIGGQGKIQIKGDYNHVELSF